MRAHAISTLRIDRACIARFVVLIGLVGILAAPGCDWLGAKRVTVEFRNAEELKGGESVYLAGVKIGVAGAPALTDGRAQVPVFLARKYKNALASGSVFLIEADPSDARKTALIAFSCSKGSPGQIPPDPYKGAANRLEFMALCGAEKAKQLFNKITD